MWRPAAAPDGLASPVPTVLARIIAFGDGSGDGARLHPGRSDHGGFVQQDLLVLGNVRFAEKGDVVVPDHESVFIQVDTGLVALQHVEPEQEVHIFAFHDGEATGEIGGADFDLGRVDAAEDLGGAHAASDARVSSINEAHDVAGFGTPRRHDGRLRARIDKGFDGGVVNFHGDVQHMHPTKRYRPVLVLHSSRIGLVWGREEGGTVRVNARGPHQD